MNRDVARTLRRVPLPVKAPRPRGRAAAAKRSLRDDDEASGRPRSIAPAVVARVGAEQPQARDAQHAAPARERELLQAKVTLPHGAAPARQHQLGGVDDAGASVEAARFQDESAFAGAPRVGRYVADAAIAARIVEELLAARGWPPRFLFAITISSRDAMTIPVHMAGAVDTRGVQFWFMAVRALIAMIPPVVIALLAQRYIVRGLTLGAVKG